ncbi:MAG: type III pantothenate kinase, partial [Clostridia bacterium]|nr:type III pantothenate kinase [Clostridia bacterium]
IDNPAQLGADLVVGAVAAIDKYPLPLVILDLGTATTISVIDKQGSFLGGPICAGIGISLEALTSKTSQLPGISIETPKSVIGKNSIDSMKAGLVIGSACMIEGLVERIEDELGEKVSIVATGGLAAEVVKNCKKEIEINDDLLLDGLKLIYEKNKK